MDLRTTKQAIYGTFYLILWIGFVALVYRVFFYAPPSCFDHLQDQGEMGIDCGGPCAAACIPTNLDTIAPVASPSVFASVPGHYTILGQLANSNPGFAARSFNYRFTLYDASDTVLAQIPGQSFMYAGEVKYLLVPNFVVSSGTVDHAALSAWNIDWVPAATLGVVPVFVVQNLGPGPVTSGTVSVAGELTDNDVAAFTNILVIAIFKDAYGNPIGASQTELDSVRPDETQTFSIIYPSNAGIAPALTSLYAYALRL